MPSQLGINEKTAAIGEYPENSFHHDKARPRIAKTTAKKLVNLTGSFCRMPLTARYYLTDFYLFPSILSFLLGKALNSDDQVRKNLSSLFASMFLWYCNKEASKTAK